MQVLRETFEAAYTEVSNDISREQFTESKNEMESYMFVHQVKFTDTVDLEDELANVEIGTLLKNKENKIELAGQNIEFVSKTGKTLTPQIAGIDLKGALKKKFLATLNFGSDTEEVQMWGKYWTKQTFQYGILSIAYYMEDWQMNRGFFMRVKTSKINKTTRKKMYNGDRYAYKIEELDDLKIQEEQLVDKLEDIRAQIAEIESTVREN